jgi:hypothetical protein
MRSSLQIATLKTDQPAERFTQDEAKKTGRNQATVVRAQHDARSLTLRPPGIKTRNCELSTMALVMHIYRPGIEAPEIRVVELNGKPSCWALYDLLRGDDLLGADAMIEHVPILVDGERRDMFVDEGGLLKGLLRNDSATGIYQAAVSNAEHPELNMSDAAWMVGVAVLFPGRRVWF